MLGDVVDDLDEGQVLLAPLLSKVNTLHPLAMVLLPPPDHPMTILVVLIKSLSSQSKVLFQVTTSYVHLQRLWHLEGGLVHLLKSLLEVINDLHVWIMVSGSSSL